MDLREAGKVVYSATQILKTIGFMAILQIVAASTAQQFGGLRRLIGGPVPSDDRLSDAPEKFDVEPLAQVLTDVVRTAIRKKQVGWPGNSGRFVALDGTPLGRSMLPGKETAKGPRGWKNWRLAETKHPEKGYVLNVVDAELMDRRNPLHMGFEFEGPNYGELSAAKTLLRRIHRDHGRHLDGVVGDAAYGCAPIVNLCKELEFYFLFRVRVGTMPTLVMEGDRKIGKRAPDWEGRSDRERDQDSWYRIWREKIAWDFDGEVEEIRFLHIEKDGAPLGDEWPRYEITNIPEGMKSDPDIANFYSWRYDDTEIQAHRQFWQEFEQHHLLSHDPTAIMARLLIVACFRNVWEIFFERVICARGAGAFLTHLLGPERRKLGSVAAERSQARYFLHETMRALVLIASAPGLVELAPGGL